MKRSERMGFQLICWQNNTLRRPHPHLSSTSCDKISFLFFWPWHRLMFQSPLRRSNPCKVFVSVTIGGQWDIVSVSIAATHAKATGLRNEDLSAPGNWTFSCSGRAADYVCACVTPQFLPVSLADSGMSLRRLSSSWPHFFIYSILFLFLILI